MTHTGPIRIATFVASLCLAAATADARPITLAWDPSPDPGVTGYILYYGPEPGTYTVSKDVLNVITYQLDLPGDQYFFAVRAYDADGNLSAYSLEVGDTASMLLTNPGNQSHMVGDNVALPLVATGATASYTAINLPPGLTVDSSTGLISGIVSSTAEASSPHLVTARVADASGHVSSVQFIWTIRAHHAPALTNPGNQSTIAGATVSLAITAPDIDGDPLSFSASGLPPGLAIDIVTGVISGTVASDAASSYDVTVSVFDGLFNPAVAFSWAISPAGALAVDQIVSVDDSGSFVTTPAFSTSVPGETLIAFVTAAQPTQTDGQTALVTGGELSWTLVTRANAQAGTAEIWTATASGLLTDVEVTATLSVAAEVSLTVVTFSNSAGVGASAAASAETGAPIVSLTTTRAGSFVYGAGNDWDGGLARTVAGTQAMVYESVKEGTGDTFWVQNYVGPVAAAGTNVDLSDAEPTTHQWNFAAVEILSLIATTTSVTAGPATVVPGATITATVVDGPGNIADWVGLFEVNAGSDAYQSRAYLDGSPLPPDTGLTSATVQFIAPATPGLYNIRLFAAGNSTTPVATSNAVLVVASSLTIDDVSIVEGNGGTNDAVFTVTLTPPSPVSVTVDYATAGGLATSGSDYVDRSGTLMFPAGTTTQTISVKVKGDATIEPDETFVVNLSNATNAAIGDGEGVATITNDDFPKLTIGDATVVEGNSGTTNAMFAVTLTPASPFGVTVDYATIDRSATAGSDYVAATGTLTFPAGTTTRTISVPVIGDTAVERDETFVVRLSNATSALFGNRRGRATIVNDDLPVLTIGDVAVVEGDNGTTHAVFTVKLSSAVSEHVTVTYATANGTATKGSDYAAESGTLTFAPGHTTEKIVVHVLGDTTVEPNETFVVKLSDATDALIQDGRGVATMTNDDVAAPPAGRMFGVGRLDEGHTRNRFAFRVSERNDREYGRVEFWSTDDRNDDDNDEDGDNCRGDRDHLYGRSHHGVRSRFESTAIASVTFSNDPGFTPGRRPPAVDSVVFAGGGKWNGSSGYTFEVRATDQGEPGRNRDTFSLVVKNSQGSVVASVSGKIDSGNIQSTRLPLK